MSQVTEFYFYRLKFVNSMMRKFFFLKIIIYPKINFFIYIFNIYLFLKKFVIKSFFFFNFRYIYRKLKKIKVQKNIKFFFLFRKRKKKLNSLICLHFCEFYLFFFFKFLVFFKWICFFLRYTAKRHNRRYRNIRRLFLQHKKRRFSFFTYLFTIITKRFPYFTRRIQYWGKKKKKFYYFFKSKTISSLSFLSKPILNYFNIKNSEKIQIPFIFKIVKKNIIKKKILYIRRFRCIYFQWRKDKWRKYNFIKKRFFFYYRSRNRYQHYSNIISHFDKKNYKISDKNYKYQSLSYKIQIQARALSKRFIKLNKFLLKRIKKKNKKYFKKSKFLFSISRMYWKLQIYLKQIKKYTIFYSQLYYFYKLRKNRKFVHNFKNKSLLYTEKLYSFNKNFWTSIQSINWNWYSNYTTVIKKKNLLSKKQLNFFANKNNYLTNINFKTKNYLYLKGKTKNLRRLFSFLSYSVTRYSPKPLFKIFSFFFTFRFMYLLISNKYFLYNILELNRKNRINLLLRGFKEHLKIKNIHSKYGYFLTKSNILYAFLLSNICIRTLRKRCFKIKRKRLSWIFFSQLSNFFSCTFLSNIKFNINFALNASISKLFIRKVFSRFLSFRPPKGNIIFLRELVNIFIIAGASKDSKIIHDWIIRNLTLVFYRKHRQFIGFFKKALLQIFPKLRKEFKVRGLLITFRGKIGQVGSVRKKAVFLRRGTQSFSNLNLRISSSTGTVTTGTGSIGVSVSLFY